MPGWPDDLEAAFLAAIEDVAPGVFKTLLPYEPRTFDGAVELPAITLLPLQAPDDDVETGPASQVTWTWRVALYASLNGGYEDGQAQLKLIWPRVLQAVRASPSLGVDGAWATLSDPGGEPEFNDAEEWVMKRLTLAIRRMELSA